MSVSKVEFRKLPKRCSGRFRFNMFSAWGHRATAARGRIDFARRFDVFHPSSSTKERSTVFPKCYFLNGTLEIERSTEQEYR
jgi:hypothetical protein